LAPESDGKICHVGLEEVQQSIIAGEFFILAKALGPIVAL
jgi:hypothetical protein